MMGIKLGSRKLNGGKKFFSKKIIALIIILLIGGAAFIYLSKQGGPGSIHKNGKNSGAQTQASSSVPDRDPDIVGMIDSVNGNQVTILKFDPSVILDLPMIQNSNNSQKNNASKNAISLGQSGGGMIVGGGGGGGFNRSGGSGSTRTGSSGGGGGQNSGSSGSNRQTIIAEIKAVSKGKEMITVPIGIPIVKADAGSSGSKAQGGSFIDLTSDTMVKVWLSNTNDGKNTAGVVEITGKVNMNNSTN